MLSDRVTDGGHLFAMRPDKQLAALAGIHQSAKSNRQPHACDCLERLFLYACSRAKIWYSHGSQLLLLAKCVCAKQARVLYWLGAVDALCRCRWNDDRCIPGTDTPCERIWYAISNRNPHPARARRRTRRLLWNPWYAL